MPARKRIKTDDYTGVYFIEGKALGTHKRKGADSRKEKTERIYYIIYRKNGKLIEEKAGRQYTDDMTAAKAARLRTLRMQGDIPSNKEARKAIEAGQQALKKQNPWTLNRLFQEFVEHKAHLKSIRDDKSRYNNHIRLKYGDKEPSKLEALDFNRLHNSLIKDHKPATVKQVLVLFKRIINFGVAKQLCSPLSFKIEMPRVDNQKTEDLTPAQLNRLFQAIEDEPNKQAANFMRMALYTGMRRSELFRLRWQDVDFERGFIHIRNPKGGKAQSIPLNDSARQVLENHPRSDSEYVFPGRDGAQRVDFKKPINRIKQRAGLPKDFRPLHGLRHVYASMLASSGQVDLYTLQKLLTHKSPQMTQRYAHLRDDTLKKASNLMGSLVAEALTDAKEDKKDNSSIA